MKDATGELSMPAVAVVAIAAISVVFTTLIWPSIKSNIVRSTHCSEVISCDQCDEKTCTCEYIKDDGNTAEVKCPVQKVSDTVNKANTANP